MTNEAPTILLLQDVPELKVIMRDALEKRGYRVVAAPDEQEATEKALSHRVGLILINVGPSPSESAPPSEAAAVARRIRARAGLGERVPAVILSSESVAEGDEFNVGVHEYVIHPNRYEQLEELLGRLLPAPA